MANNPKSPVTVRFYLGRGIVKARKTSADTARAILRRVTFQYADGAYDQFRKTLSQQLELDVRMELEHMASLFRKHIIGFSGRRSTPSGTLDTVTKGAEAPTMLLSSALPPWAPRNAEYLRNKRIHAGNIRWFDNTSWVNNTPDMRYAGIRQRVGDGPDSPGLLKSIFTHDSWESMFGPISVQFFRSRKLSPDDAAGGIISKGKSMKTQIGSVYVRAIGKIEPNMLPGFTTGTVRGTSTYNGSLMNVVAETDPRLAYRLGRMRNGIYRPTLEPFLGFFLTKALPFAVNRRIQKGTLGSIIIKP